MPWSSGQPVVFFVLAAFPPQSSSRLKGISFGVDYDATKFVVLAHGTCADFELPDNDWPDPGSGTAQSWLVTQTGPLVEAYWMAGYAYSEESPDTTSFAVIPHPVQGGYFADDSEPRQADEIEAYGRLGFGTAGALPCPIGGGDMVWVPGGGLDSQEGQGDDSEPAEGGGGSPSSALELTFVQMTTVTDSAFAVAARDLRKQYGLDIAVGMTPDGLLCQMSKAQRDVLQEDARVTLVTSETIAGVPDAATETLEPDEPGSSAQTWNSLLTGPPPGAKCWRGDKSFALRDTCVYFGDSEEDRYTRRGWQTANYMLGDIGVSLLFMESESSGPCAPPDYPEDWTPFGRSVVRTQIIAALNTLHDLRPPGTRVAFWPQQNVTLGTIEEPIQGPPNNPRWVREAMQALPGTNGSTLMDSVYSYCNVQRAQSSTNYDWWFIAFAINDSCDTDHKFAGGSIASYGMASAACVLLPYNGGGGLDVLDAVTMHETCHIFGAADEYRYDGGCGVHYGYLDEINGNGWADSSGTICVGPQRQCIMSAGLDRTLCSYTQAHVGWTDSDSVPDGIPDPIDHPKSNMSMLIGEADSLAEGDSIDIQNDQGAWAKRLTASDWSLHRGRMLWDGICFDHRTHGAGTYWWRRNGGSWFRDTLAVESSAPVISDLMLSPGGPEVKVDTLSFRFTDADTHAGRVRAYAWCDSVDQPEVSILDDQFSRETQQSEAPITKTFTPAYDALWTVTLRVWDVGDGFQTRADSSYVYITSGLDEQRVFVPELALSPGRPNPSDAWIGWDLELPSAGRVDLRVIGVDGRCLRAWLGKALLGGVTRILWDGLDARGARVASGRYYLVVTDQAGDTRSTPVTVVR